MDTHPARFFIRAQFLASVAPTHASIVSVCRRYGVVPPTEDEFATLSEIAIPARLTFSPLDQESFDWLQSQRVSRLLVLQDDSVAAALKIQSSTSLRRKVQVLYLGKCSPSDVARGLSNPAVTVPSLQDWEHYFWNGEGLSEADWEDYIRKEGEAFRTRTTGALSALRHGPESAKTYAGIHQRVDHTKALYDALALNEVIAKEVLEMPAGPDKILGARAVVSNAVRLHRELAETGEALQDTMSAFGKFRARRTKETLPTLASVAPRGSTSSTAVERKK